MLSKSTWYSVDCKTPVLRDLVVAHLRKLGYQSDSWFSETWLEISRMGWFGNSHNETSNVKITVEQVLGLRPLSLFKLRDGVVCVNLDCGYIGKFGSSNTTNVNFSDFLSKTEVKAPSDSFYIKFHSKEQGEFLEKVCLKYGYRTRCNGQVCGPFYQLTVGCVANVCAVYPGPKLQQFLSGQYGTKFDFGQIDEWEPLLKVPAPKSFIVADIEISPEDVTKIRELISNGGSNGP